MKRHANLSIFIPHAGCPHRCSFCEQVRISGAKSCPTPGEVAELCESYLPAPGEGSDTEIAFFGGSFTAIDRRMMIAFLEAAHPYVQAGRAAGIRLSTRPDAIDREVLDILSAYGVTSIELGAQSMDDEVLRINGRGHTAADVERASALIRERGFSLGLQMMTGLPGERGDLAASSRRTAERFITLRPDTVRVYPTIVVENTQLCDWYRAGQYAPPGLEETVEAVAGLLLLFESAGIVVIRAGLHSDPSLQSAAVAGPFHPAFGELCRSRALRKALLEHLGQPLPECCEVSVSPKNLSAMIGQKRENIAFFARLGCTLTVRGDVALTGSEMTADISK